MLVTPGASDYGLREQPLKCSQLVHTPPATLAVLYVHPHIVLCFQVLMHLSLLLKPSRASSPLSGAAVGGCRSLWQPSKKRCEGWETAFLFSMLCTVSADAPDAVAVGMWETTALPASSKQSGISMAGALRGVPA